MSTASQELDSLHSVLIAAQRSVRLERHTLILIGAVGGFLGTFTEYVISPEAFPGQTQRGLAICAWIGFWLASVSWLDNTLTRRLRQERAETLPFAQVQITRAWWMLLALGTLGSLATFVYGGQQMIYVLWTILLGVGIYQFGLFCRPLVEWIGIATMLLGIVELPAHLTFNAIRWVLAGSCGIGIPLAGWLAQRNEGESWSARLGTVMIWVGAVLVPTALFADTLLLVPAAGHPVTLDAGRVMNSNAREMAGGERTIRLEAGSSLPMTLDIDGPPDSVTRIASQATLTLSQPIEFALVDGQPERYRLGDGIWRDLRKGSKTGLAIDAIEFRMERVSPIVQLRAHVNNGNGGRQDGQP